MVVEYKNRILQAFRAGNPLDAYPKDLRHLQKFGDAYVKKTRETDSQIW